MSNPRSVPIVARIVPNMWPPFEQQTSIERLGRMPASRSRPVAGQPWPICSSMSGEIEAVQPASAIIRSSSSASVLQCTNVIVGPSSPCSASCAIGRLLPHSPSPKWQLMRMPSSSASAQSSAVDLHGRELVAARRQAERDERVVRGEAPLAQPAHVVGRVRQRADGLPVPVARRRGRRRRARRTRRAASTAASVWSGVLRLCDQSRSVVIPQSSASSVPIRLPRRCPPGGRARSSSRAGPVK